MIRGVHTMFYSSEPEALRAFFRDKLSFTAHDVGGGWLIFDLPEADLGCHPAGDGTAEGDAGKEEDGEFVGDHGRFRNKATRPVSRRTMAPPRQAPTILAMLMNGN